MLTNSALFFCKHRCFFVTCRWFNFLLQNSIIHSIYYHVFNKLQCKYDVKQMSFYYYFRSEYFLLLFLYQFIQKKNFYHWKHFFTAKYNIPIYTISYQKLLFAIKDIKIIWKIYTLYILNPDWIFENTLYIW